MEAIYYYESHGTGYICTGWKQYAWKETHGQDLYTFAEFHQVRRKPTFEEARAFYALAGKTGGLCGGYDFEPVLLSPTHTEAAGNETLDWSAEMDRINSTSKAAMEWVNKAVGTEGIFVGGFYVAVDDDTVEVRQIKQGEEGVPILNDVEMEPIHTQMDYCDWVCLAEFVQKALSSLSSKTQTTN